MNQRARVELLKDFKKSSVVVKLTVVGKMDWGRRGRIGERVLLKDSDWNLGEKW